MTDTIMVVISALQCNHYHMIRLVYIWSAYDKFIITSCSPQSHLSLKTTEVPVKLCRSLKKGGVQTQVNGSVNYTSMGLKL